MSIKHHLTEQLLMGYAAGTLPEAFNLVVASHISMCDDCRAALAAYDEAKKLNLPALYCKHYNDVRLTPFGSMPERRFTASRSSMAMGSSERLPLVITSGTANSRSSR